MTKEQRCDIFVVSSFLFSRTEAAQRKPRFITDYYKVA